MGRAQSISPPPCFASTRRLPLRVCLRKGCGRIYQPRRWNRRYCQDPACLKLLRRWQNAQRQQQRRQRAEVCEQQAAAKRQRRQRRRQTQATPRAPPKPDPPPDGGAWSHRRKNSAPFCQRPGCYVPLPAGTYDLVAYQPPLTQVLSLPSVRLERKECHALRALFQTLNEPGDPP